MKNIMQTEFGQHKGNCFQATVASILDMELADVPNFCVEYGDSWFHEFYKWTLANTQFSPVMYLIADHLEMKHNFPTGTYLVCGKSPRGAFNHSVVYKDCELIHDPHPSGDGIENYRDIIVFNEKDGE